MELIRPLYHFFVNNNNVFNPTQPKCVEIGENLLQRLLTTHSRLLISEDINQLKSAFHNELHLQNTLQCHQTTTSTTKNKNVYSLSTITAFLLATTSTAWYMFGPFNTVLFTGGVCLFYLAYKHQTNRFYARWNSLLIHIEQEKDIYRKLMQLLEDGMVQCATDEQQSQLVTRNRLQSLKVAFSRLCLQSVIEWRRSTRLLLDNFPLKTDIEQSLICSLPDDILDSFSQYEELTLKSLKSLKQLIRLHISEFLKCFLFLFIQNYYVKSNDCERDIVMHLRVEVISQLEHTLASRRDSLFSLLHYHRSFYRDSDTTLPPTSVTGCNDKQIDLWPFCRTIRKSLYSSLEIVDLCEATLDNGLNEETSSHIESQIVNLNGQIINMQRSVQSIQKILSMQKLKTSVSTNDTEIELNTKSMDSSERLNGNTVAYVEECTLPKDEVFEAYVPNQFFDDDENESNSKSTENAAADIAEMFMSGCVFHELKHALKSKAIEHKVREAKVLGLQVDVEQLEKEYQNALSEQNETSPNKGNRNRKEKEEEEEIITTSSKLVENSASFTKQSSFDLQLRLALQMASQSRDLNEDTFECNTPDQSDDEIE